MAFKLEITYDFTFDLIGIVSAERGFKLAWLLNQLLGIHFVRKEDIEQEYLDGSIMRIANFQYETDHDSYRLLKNRAHWSLHTQKPFLLPELKEYDYLLIIDNVTKLLDIDTIKEHIAQLPIVQYCLTFDLDHIKDKENLIF